jgi:hypothetical protein
MNAVLYGLPNASMLLQRLRNVATAGRRIADRFTVQQVGDRELKACLVGGDNLKLKWAGKFV